MRSNARCAGRDSGQRDSAERSCSCRFEVGSVCRNLAIYQCSRPTRACSGRRFASCEIVRFSASVSATMWQPSIGGGAAKAQPVRRHPFIALAKFGAAEFQLSQTHYFYIEG